MDASPNVIPVSDPAARATDQQPLELELPIPNFYRQILFISGWKSNGFWGFSVKKFPLIYGRHQMLFPATSERCASIISPLLSGAEENDAQKFCAKPPKTPFPTHTEGLYRRDHNT
jgi:hypothetical protein